METQYAQQYRKIILSPQFFLAFHIVLHPNINNVQGNTYYRAWSTSYTGKDDLGHQTVMHQAKIFPHLIHAKTHTSADHLTYGCRSETIIEPLDSYGINNVCNGIIEQNRTEFLLPQPLSCITLWAVSSIPFLFFWVCICVLTRSKGATKQATPVEATPPNHQRGRRSSLSSVSARTVVKSIYSASA